VYRILFDALVTIAVMFTLYSWFKYLFKRQPAKA
jgi:hypothetical protein